MRRRICQAMEELARIIIMPRDVNRAGVEFISESIDR
jgi:hypothetical protein